MKQNNKQEKWEEEFDEKFVGINGTIYSGELTAGKIKQFIKATLIKEYRKGYNKALKDNKITDEKKYL